MASYTIKEDDRDPSRITIEFFDRASVDFIVRDGTVLRGSITIPAHREEADLESAFGKRNLGIAEKAALNHFAPLTKATFDTVMRARAIAFNGYIRKTHTQSGTQPSYANRVLISLADTYLKSVSWDIEPHTLVAALRALWSEKGAETRRQNKLKAPEAAKREARAAWREELRKSQLDLFPRH